MELTKVSNWKLLILLLALLGISASASKSRPKVNPDDRFRSIARFGKNDVRISFDSKRGKELLRDEHTNLDTYFSISENFETQATQAYCGVASGTIILNCFRDEINFPVDPAYSPYNYLTQRMFMKNSCVDKIMGIRDFFIFMGMSLHQLADSLRCFDTRVEAVYYDDFENEDVQAMQFRMMEALDAGKFVIANIDRPELDEKGGGHFSPIAAYSLLPLPIGESHALFLFMDVARYKYEPMWVDGVALMNAMKKKDSSSKRSRGFLIVDAPSAERNSFQKYLTVDI